MDLAAFSQAADDVVDNCRTIFCCSMDSCADVCPLQCVLVNNLANKLSFYYFGFICTAGWDFGVYRSMWIQSCQIILFFFSLVLAFFWQKVLAFGEQQKLGLALIAFAITIAAYYFSFKQTTFRRKPLSLLWSLRSVFYPHTWGDVEKGCDEEAKAEYQGMASRSHRYRHLQLATGEPV